jgi:hypothetical protein
VGDGERSTGGELDRVRAELEGLAGDRLSAVNVDVTGAAMVVLAAAAEARKLRPAMVLKFGEEDASAVDRLELVARAALAAAAEHMAYESGVDVGPLSDQACALRETLVLEVRSLVSRKRLPRGLLSVLRGAGSFRGQVADLLHLSGILRRGWTELGDFVGIEVADLDRAEALAAELAAAVGARDVGGQSPTAALRQRAFTLMANTYDDVRRMVSYLRWKDGDADAYTPSFYAGRRGRKRTGEEASAPPAAVDPLTAEPGHPDSNPFPNG